MKRAVGFLSVLIFSINIFFAKGLFPDEKKLKVVQTEWFDIIYPSECEKTAALLYQNADKIYSEVTDFMEISKNVKLPVVITPEVEQNNAFFNPFPYNHIVLYDTSVNGVEELAVFSEQFLSSFKHELTHAVTFNMKNDFWAGAGKVFGDVAALGYLSISTGIAEGATVSCESADGEGRLNDEYALHPVKQAKIEGKFPTYYDAQGASTIHNVAHPYFFNGAFAKYLQDTFGMQAYSNFWYYTVNLKNGGLQKRFYKAFGVKLKTAWKNFEETYEVPEVPSNPVEAGIVSDFFNPTEKVYSKYNNEGSDYSSLSSSKEKLVWLDSNTGKIFMAEKNSSSAVKPETIITVPQAYAVNISDDGKYLVVSMFTSSSSSKKAQLAVYDFNTNQFYKIKETGLKTGGIICKNGDYYILSEKYSNALSSIKIQKLQFAENGKIVGVENYSEIVLGPENMPYNFISLPDGDFAYLLKNRMDYSICISDIEGNLKNEYKMPESDMVVRSLSYNSNNSGAFYFSWASENTLPRVGKFDLNTKQMVLSDQDISGGVFNPVACDDKIIYIGNFYEQSRLLQLKSVSGANYEISGIYDDNNKIQDDIKNQLAENDDFYLPEGKKFNSFDYYKKGVFIPLSLYTTEYFGNKASTDSIFKASILGATYITSNPWTTLDDDLLIFTCGYNLFNYSLGFGIDYYKGTNTELFKTKTTLKTEFDDKGWKQSSLISSSTSVIPFGKMSSLLLSNAASAKIGRQDNRITNAVFAKQYHYNLFKTFGKAKSENNIVFYELKDTFGIGYSNVHYVGSGIYNKSGIKTQVVLYWLLQDAINSTSSYYKNRIDVATSFKFYVPKLLPLKNDLRFTYNLPASFGISLFPATTNMVYTNIPIEEYGYPVLNVGSEIVLFAYNVEKSIPFFTCWYLNSIMLSCGYAGEFVIQNDLVDTGKIYTDFNYYSGLIENGGIDYYNSVYLRFTTKSSPNIGRLAGIFYFDLFGQVTYAFNNNNYPDRFLFSFGINSSF